MDDLMLLKTLENNPRIALRDLAAVLNEDADRVKAEVERLEKEKVIGGYHTVINWDKTDGDHVSAIIEVSAKPQRDVGYDQIANKIAHFEEVSSVYLTVSYTHLTLPTNSRV